MQKTLDKYVLRGNCGVLNEKLGLGFLPGLCSWQDPKIHKENYIIIFFKKIDHVSHVKLKKALTEII